MNAYNIDREPYTSYPYYMGLLENLKKLIESEEAGSETPPEDPPKGDPPSETPTPLTEEAVAKLIADGVAAAMKPPEETPPPPEDTPPAELTSERVQQMITEAVAEATKAKGSEHTTRPPVQGAQQGGDQMKTLMGLSAEERAKPENQTKLRELVNKTGREKGGAL